MSPADWATTLTGACAITGALGTGLWKLHRVLVVIESRTVELDANGGESMRDNSERARVASEAALELVERVADRLDRHLEHHAALPLRMVAPPP